MILVAEDDASDDNAAVISSIRFRRNPILSETTHQTSADIFYTNNRSYSRHADEEAYCIDNVEAAASSQVSDGADETRVHRSHYQEMREIVTRFWLWEVAACAFSLVCLASIVGVLIYEDGKQLDQWSWSVPPTAVISFIGTMAKASIVLVLSQALSQLKWLYFRRARSLRHLRVFDSGSRGPLGAFWVMWNSKKPLVTIAAILMILTVLVDPFFQLVFTFPSRLVEDQSQQAIFQRVYDVGNIPTLSMWENLNQGLVSNDTSRTAICTSGSCIWTEPIRTIGLCGSCSDAGSDVQVNCSTIDRSSRDSTAGDFSQLLEHWLTCSYVPNELPSLSSFSAYEYSSSTEDFGSNIINLNFIERTIWNSTAWLVYNTLSNLTFVANRTQIQIDGHDDPANTPSYQEGASEQYPESFTVDVIDNTQLVFHAIQLPNISSRAEQGLYNHSTLPQAKYWSCEINWCERVFEDIRATGNAPLTYTTSTQPLWFVSAAVGDSLLGFYPNEISSLNLSTVWNFKYRVQPLHYGYMTELFTSYYVQNGEPARDWRGSYAFNDDKVDLDSNPGAVLGLVYSDDMNATINAIAEQLSEYIRTGPNAVNVTGQAIVAKSFIHVRWAWLALPLALVSITCVILTIVAIKSKSEEVAVWKDDPLALLFHHVEAVDVISGSDKFSKSGPRDLDNLADEVHVRLDRDVPFTFVRSKA